MADGTSLMVQSDTLKFAGQAFIDKADELDGKLDELSTKIGELTGSWKDSNCPDFISKFSQFVTDAKTINADLRTLGEFAKTMAGSYNDAVTTALGSMV